MANQLNYAEPLTDLINQRPYRPTKRDEELSIRGSKMVIFGTTPDDNIEVWFYNGDGSTAGNLRLAPEDPAITLSTTVDSTGAYEFVNLDLDAICQRANLAPGRYGVTINFFRDEVGGLEKYHLYIDEISQTRKELRLKPERPTAAVLKDMYEFLTPSVPKVYAQALTDQIFGKDVNPTPGKSISAASVGVQLNNDSSNTTARIIKSGGSDSYKVMIQKIIDRTHQEAIDNMLADAGNLNVQHVELQNYIEAALTKVVYEMISKKEIDPRF